MNSASDHARGSGGLSFDKVLGTVRWIVMLRVAALLIALVTLPVRTALPASLARALAMSGGALLLINLGLLLWHRRVTAVLRDRPLLLLADLGLSVAVMQLGGGWRSSYFVYTLTTTMLFAVFLKWRGTTVATVVMMLGALLKDPAVGASPITLYSAGSWDMRLGASLFYVTAGLIMGYVVSLIDKVEDLSRADVERARTLSALHERTRLSLELHDGAKQIVTAALLRLKPLIGEQEMAVDALQTEVRWLWRAINYLQSEIVQVMQTLRSEGQIRAPSCDVVAMAQEEARIAGDITGLSWTVCAQQDTIGLPAACREPLRRFFSEALMNAAKHSGARAGTIELDSGEKGVDVIVCDEGRGFDYDSRQSSGTGLQSLHNRAAQLDASLVIDTAPGEGCRVVLHVGRGPGEPDG